MNIYTVAPAMKKECRDCGVSKPLSLFDRKERGLMGARPECKACRSANRRIRYAKDEAHRRSILDKQKQHNAANPARNRAKVKAWRLANLAKASEAQKSWRQQNREKDNEYKRAWRKRNRHAVNSFTAKRYASKVSATPPWANPAAIKAIYASAIAQGKQVDHIVPLRSKLVCGLHCEANLQLLTPQENLAKNNRRWPDMP